MERLEDRIKRMIVERLMLTIDPKTISDNDNLITKFKVDSPMVMEFVIGIEEYFNIPLSDEEFSAKRFSTVRGIAEVLRPRLGLLTK